VILMDIRKPELDGLEATRRILAANSSARILILTTFGLDEYVYEALRAGASGFVLKDDPPRTTDRRGPRRRSRKRSPATSDHETRNHTILARATSPARRKNSTNSPPVSKKRSAHRRRTLQRGDHRMFFAL
jgi:DNA-binding NarL/FixJ family response regulator